jgi:hypothetical protein
MRSDDCILMKTLLAMLLVVVFSAQTRASESADGWSETVNGLKAQLSLERDQKSPFLKVFIELQNTFDVAGIRKIRFDPKAIDLRVTDAANTPLAKANGSYDGTSPTWEPLLLPFEGNLRFRISFPGLGYRPGTDRTILDLGPAMSWVIPGDKEYFVSGTLTIAKKEGDHPYSDWSGTLTLPAIKIPAVSQDKSGGAASGSQPIRSALVISGNPTRSSSPYEIVLEGEKVVFDKAESVSIQITVRDLGVKKMIAPDLYWGLSVVWDGREYKRDPKYIGNWNGPWEIIPKTAWRTGFSLSEYLVPVEVLTAGGHTIALKDASAESNTLTVFIEKTK